MLKLVLKMYQCRNGLCFCSFYLNSLPPLTFISLHFSTIHLAASKDEIIYEHLHSHKLWTLSTCNDAKLQKVKEHHNLHIYIISAQ